MELSLSNVINITISAVQTGINAYNTSNLALYTTDMPGMTFGSAGYAAYLSPQQVGIDFGTSSKTYQMANAVFSQQPNILTGDGMLIVILLEVASETLTFSGVAASGTFVINFSGNPSAAINWNDTAAQIQTKLQAVSGLSQVVVTGSIAAESLVIKMWGVYGAAPALVTISANSLETSGSVAITVTPTISTPGESIGAAITRTAGLIQYFGIIVDKTLAIIGQTDLLACAAIVQPLVKIALFVSYTSADIQPGGMIDLLRTGSFTQTRGLFYDDNSSNGINAILMCAAYAGRGFSTDYTGSNTVSTMHLKTLVGIQPDPNITQTLLNNAVAAGADTYVSLQGVPAVFCSGTNLFFDQIYARLWFAGAQQVAGFNYLAGSATKVPQTENGMDGLKGAYRTVCEQGVTNGYMAPGTWNSSTTFGNSADLIANVAQVGYYIYSQPIAQQSQANRVLRQAPLIQMAIKEAGAIQSSDVVVYVNA
jgi:hypothetical protein